MKLEQAQRNQVKLRLGLSGASGFGKSYSALLLAYGITNDWTKIAIIDTENNSASLYAHLGEYNVLSLDEPYSPERYIKAIKTCEEASMEVIIIDSITQEWQGKGGCLQIHEQLGGRFQDWSKVSPRHQAFIDAILQSKCHIITTARRKIDYSLDSNQNGRTKVIKHGTKEITREGFEYELTTNFELINDKHLAVASKDRTGLFMNKPEFVISKGTGKLLKDWCNNGKSEKEYLAEIQQEIELCENLEGLRHIYGKYPNYQIRIKDSVLQRKAEIENVSAQIIPNNQIIQPTKKSQNGIDSKQ
ncbi:signal recognition particle subunit FFH/SRP54 (srp54) [Lutibacter agarilyticus]|uniref:Signal recognition particle subunit FFH/SRP54 (Srp54) n=1 Tax=Lutibacter agarilyticus TaxID=1109740 RepID=A0A238YBI2_9FLAO|nr:AAA family ATPase [Lutibacter agarilyticus]SNR68636.1 signal recognition particle subunit FFH/SRP54 (srp54) [Lutibacter agarilyticus]